MEEILINDRICPQPQHWNQIWNIITSKTDKKVSAPLILAAWWVTSDEEKLERFVYHINIAQRLNELEQVKKYIGSLNESDWHHKGE